MAPWKIVLLHTKRETLLKQVFERAFPGQVVSLHTPRLGERMYWQRRDMVDYFRRNVYDSGIWRDRVLTIYGNGEFHQYTYALTRLACARRGLHSWDWTYCHFDNHRDDWGPRNSNGEPPSLMCANFVDSLVHDHRGIPFLIGPVVYADKDRRGYRVHGERIPIFHNQFSKHAQKEWPGYGSLWCQTNPRVLPARRDLEMTPTDAYLTFDLDMLSVEDIVTNYDQGPTTIRDLCRLVDRVREYKRVFSADILGFPDDCHHPLSALTMLILARKVMGLGTERLLNLHDSVKAAQRKAAKQDKKFFSRRDRPSPIAANELLERISYG